MWSVQYSWPDQLVVTEAVAENEAEAVGFVGSEEVYGEFYHKLFRKENARGPE